MGIGNLQPTISCLNGYQEHETKLLTASPDYQTTKQYQSHSHHAHSHKFRQISLQYMKSNITTMQNNQGHKPANIPSITNPVTSDLPTVETAQDITLKPLTANRYEALLQMQRMDPFCKCISKWLSNGKAPQHEADLFTHIKGLYTNMSWMQIRNCWPSYYPKLENTQY